MACNHRYPTNIENSSTQNTRLIIYFIIVSMNLFEVKIFNIVININCRHQWDVLQLVSITYVTFYTKLQIITLKIAHKNEPCSPATGRETWLLFSVWGMSWGIQNPYFTMFSLVICL